MRKEHDLLGELEIPADAYYGIQTFRSTENFKITGLKLCDFPDFIKGLAYTKEAAAEANHELGYLSDEVYKAMVQACKEVAEGKFDKEFVVDMIQGGAGTSTNMNANEVIANRANEILGKPKGSYNPCHPNNHVNFAQSTNDAYPTAAKLGICLNTKPLIEELKRLILSFRKKAEDLGDNIKMGRTQLQDAVPMTLGQEFESYAASLEDEIEQIEFAEKNLYTINMGATAIGTGINSDPMYTPKVTDYLSKISALPLKAAKNMIAATNDTSGFVTYSSELKRLSAKLSKICSDLRLLSSGPRTGLYDISLPPMQPGSSIMPGKVNPVIPEVVNQICYRVIGNDTAVILAAESAQLELNVFEPVMIYSIFESIKLLINGMKTLRERCIDGIVGNYEHCKNSVLRSIGLVTALNPVIGYEASSDIAKTALRENKGVYDLVLERGLLSKEKLDEVLKPENMTKPRKLK
ncbi:aspartate ammonia-lyase [Treponema pedis]|uniref:Aspartate ammonia-lyase n=1 Tax=Treponema pedis TaxID=409322 RepID=A0A7S6WP05_9SPIR|nr:aspartate ammonia-lyase [Treponema pedis]QOW60137.1 aspartate ammonia-lyase [Treponema pedis]